MWTPGIHTTCIARHPNWKPNIKEYRGVREYDVHELKCDPGAAVNILHKVNSRLGGHNVLLKSHHNEEGQLFIRETMILATDVTHPRLGNMREYPVWQLWLELLIKNLTSIASVRSQTSRKESTEAFDEMVGDRLDLWKERNAFVCETGRPRYPKRIVIFGEGVSESLFQMILKYEWPQIQATIGNKYRENNRHEPPKLMLMCVLQRHKTRIFPTDHNVGDDNGNPRCGLVVDERITCENVYDFYLQSH